MMRDNQKQLRCWAEINLAAFERNIKGIQAAMPKKMRYLAVVKADAHVQAAEPANAGSVRRTSIGQQVPSDLGLEDVGCTRKPVQGEAHAQLAEADAIPRRGVEV